MKNKLTSLLSTIAITCAAAVPLLLPPAQELPVQALISEPSDYQFYFKPIVDGGFVEYRVGNVGTGSSYIANPEFTRTANSTYYDYNATFSWSTLEVRMRFDRSNTTWTNTTGDLYYPDQIAIGSNNTVGSIPSKWHLEFDNDSNTDYLIYVDLSTTNLGGGTIGLTQQLVTRTEEFSFFNFTTQQAVIVLPAYSTVKLFTPSTSAVRYFDAWYLKSLGVSPAYTNGVNDNSAAYDAGFDAGYDAADAPNTLISAAESIIGIFVNFTFIIFSLEIFGVSILTIVGVLFGILAITWILKTLRG
jgi:hypothetical protein